MGIPVELAELEAIAQLPPGRYDVRAIGRAANQELSRLANRGQVPGLGVKGDGPTGTLLTRRFAQVPDGRKGDSQLVLQAVGYNPGREKTCATTGVVSPRHGREFTDGELGYLARVLAQVVAQSLG